jgi:hypothetical protein
MSDKPSSPHEDRRQFKRAAHMSIVTYRLKSPFEVTLQMGDWKHAAVALDVSQGGVGIDVGQEIPVGTQVLLRFEIVNEFLVADREKQRKFELEGEVRYCESTNKKAYRVGIFFKKISAEDIEFIAGYVKDHALKKYLD